jgi:hypothetical protein
MVIRWVAAALLWSALAATDATAAPPANDAFPGTALAWDSAVVGTTVDASAEGLDAGMFPGEPFDDLATVWYSVTAPVTRWTTIDTCGSDLDTQIAIGDAGGVRVFDDDSPVCGDDDVGSALTFLAEAGTTYDVVVDGYLADQGDFVVRVRPDTDGPDTQFTGSSPHGGLGAFPGDTEAIFENFQGNEPQGYLGPPPSTFECSLDGAAFTGCVAPVALHELTVGMHVFRVRALDAAGNADPSPAAMAWDVRPAPQNPSPLPPAPLPGPAPQPLPAGKPRPRGLTAHVAPTRDRRKPYVFRVSGRLLLRSTSMPQGCGGTVTASLLVGRRELARRTVPVSARCAWSARLVAKRAARLVVTAHYNGSNRLDTWDARPVKARAG